MADPGYPPQAPPPDQAVYPPPDAYPPHQAYPPQQLPPEQAYPQQAPPQGYPPQQGYPPAQPQPYPPQGAYPPQPGYPPQQPYPQPAQPPPPYYPDQKPPPTQTETTNTVVVVQQQPQVVTVHRTYYGTGDRGMATALVVTFLSICFCCWIPLFCSIPAIFVAINAQNAAARGDEVAAKQNQNISYGLSFAALATGIILYILWIISAAAG